MVISDMEEDVIDTAEYMEKSRKDALGSTIPDEEEDRAVIDIVVQLRGRDGSLRLVLTSSEDIDDEEFSLHVSKEIQNAVEISDHIVSIGAGRDGIFLKNG